jgi:hypothetical protein
MSSGYERPDSGDGGTACAYTDHEAADGVEYGDGSPGRGEGAA